jgi:hypothetical protein
MIDIQGRPQEPNDVDLHVARCWVPAPGDAEIRAHPLDEPGFVLVDEHDSVGPARLVRLLFQQEPCQRAGGWSYKRPRSSGGRGALHPGGRHSALTKDSWMYRRKLLGKTSNGSTLRQR